LDGIAIDLFTDKHLCYNQLVVAGLFANSSINVHHSHIAMGLGVIPPFLIDVKSRGN